MKAHCLFSRIQQKACPQRQAFLHANLAKPSLPYPGHCPRTLPALTPRTYSAHTHSSARLYCAQTYSAHTYSTRQLCPCMPFSRIPLTRIYLARIYSARMHPACGGSIARNHAEKSLPIPGVRYKASRICGTAGANCAATQRLHARRRVGKRPLACCLRHQMWPCSYNAQTRLLPRHKRHRPLWRVWVATACRALFAYLPARACLVLALFPDMADFGLCFCFQLFHPSCKSSKHPRLRFSQPCNP